MRVLIIEDEHKIAAALKKGLEQENYAVDLAYDGEEGYDFAASEDYAVIILDLMLPKLDGVTVCKNLRANSIHTPILMLTAKSEISDKVNGLNQGADDYLTKPFAFAELLARVKALTRRPKKTANSKLIVSDLTLDTNNFSVTRGENNIFLSRKEFSLLEYLMHHPNTILSKDQIIQAIWDYEADVLPNTVEVYIGYLRKKIDTAFPKLPRLIHTIRGFGYKIQALESSAYKIGEEK
jgi:DNA-binding response OmpR family regulator